MLYSERHFLADCRDHDGLHCPDDEVCCGHECVCPAPRLRDKAGQCRGKVKKLSRCFITK